MRRSPYRSLVLWSFPVVDLASPSSRPTPALGIAHAYTQKDEFRPLHRSVLAISIYYTNVQWISVRGFAAMVCIAHLRRNAMELRRPSPVVSRADQTQPVSGPRTRSSGRASLHRLEGRISELERLATSQSHELAIQFERIAQLQAEYDILRIRPRRRDTPAVADCASRRRRSTRRCRRYLRLMDRASRVWFHTFKEFVVNSFERLHHNLTSFHRVGRGGPVACGSPENFSRRSSCRVSVAAPVLKAARRFR